MALRIAYGDGSHAKVWIGSVEQPIALVAGLEKL